jgi:hypothetical protein
MRKLVVRVALAASLVLGLVGANVLAAPSTNGCDHGGGHAAGPHSVPPGLSAHCGI